MRVAILCHGDAAVEHDALELAEALRHAGHDTRLLIGPGYPAVESFLLWRGFTEGLSSVFGSVRELRRGDFDVAHAFTAVDACAALRWGGPVVFGVAEVLGRERVANRRQRLALLSRAVAESAAVVATGDEQRAALARWLAVDVPVLAPGDAAGHGRLYAGLS